MSRKRKYTDEFKLKVVQEYLSGMHGGYLLLSQKYGIDDGQLRFWVKFYESQGAAGLCSKNPSYSGEFRQHVVEYMNKEKMSLRSTAVMFDIPSDSTVAKWNRIYHEKGPEALFELKKGCKKLKKEKSILPTTDKRKTEEILEENRRLRMENEFLKKLNALTLEREKTEKKKL